MSFIKHERIYGSKKQLMRLALYAGAYLIVLYFVLYFIASLVIDAHIAKDTNFRLNHHAKDIVVILDMILCFSIYTTLLIRFIGEKINSLSRLISHVRLIKSGNLTEPIPISGNDEMAHLALHLNELRLQLAKNQLNLDQQAKKENELLTSISHDLRTPLTSLLGYLEILADHHEEKNSEMKEYVALCLKRTRQVQYLVNTSFEHFYLTDKSQETIELLRCNSINHLLLILSDRAEILKQNGFSYALYASERHYAIVYDERLMERLFDNIFTNILRYAQRASAIKILVSIEKEGLLIRIHNLIDKNRKSNESTGIGIRNCHQIMALHKGYFETAIHKSTFIATIFMPINNHSDAFLKTQPLTSFPSTF